MSLMYECACGHRQFVNAPCDVCWEIGAHLVECKGDTPQAPVFGYRNGSDVLAEAKKRLRKNKMNIVIARICVFGGIALIVVGIVIAWLVH